jgi:Ca-activated chloride channel homolog
MAIGNRQWICVTLVALFIFGAPLPAHVAGPKVPRNTRQPVLNRSVIKMNVDMTLVNVSVTDSFSNSVTWLDKENFKVYEDGVEQEISAFSSEDVPISIGLIFDMSGSMANKFDRARQAAVQFLRTANPRDEFFLVRFKDRAEPASQFTSGTEELENRVMFTAAGGRTARCRLPRFGPDEECTQRQTCHAHHLRRRR